MTLEARIADRLAQAFNDAPTLEERIRLANGLAGQRLPSHRLALVWAEWTGQHVGSLGHAQKVRLAKEMLLLSPNHDRAEALCQALAPQRSLVARDRQPVFMIVSCAKYLNGARTLRSQLAGTGALAWIILGEPERSEPDWRDGVVAVPVEDTYERLPLKVAKGVEALIERYGATAIVKIDDDCRLAANFDLRRFQELAAQHDYVGVACGSPMHDRVWHFGKTSQPMGVYARRYRGRWARGACYLLGAHAAGLIAREALLFPGEFSCEYYEDKAVGDVLRAHGIALSAIGHDAEWGIAVDLRDRPFAEPVGPRAPQPAVQLPVGDRSELISAIVA
ncbi:MAG: hypothetical protein OEU93_06530 [Rubrivivax sp.]|nr:hypothetical protein [Rubrivivax sp.]